MRRKKEKMDTDISTSLLGSMAYKSVHDEEMYKLIHFFPAWMNSIDKTFIMLDFNFK